MELEERLSYLENVRDWQSFVEELEKGIASSAQNADKAQFHLKLGRVLETKFLAGVKALKHFQDAYKLNPALIESLESARSVYWGLGKLNMVQKLLELELKARGDSLARERAAGRAGRRALRPGRLGEGSGDVRARPRASGGKNPEASACLEDVQVEAGTCEERIEGARPPRERRATTPRRRRARSCGPRASRGVLRPTMPKGCSRVPTPPIRRTSRSPRSTRGSSPSRARFDTLEQAQTQALQQASGAKARGAMALTFGTRWVLRHQNLEVGTRFLEEALKLDPQNEGAFFFLREAYGKKAATGPRARPRRRGGDARRERRQHVPARPGRDDRVAAARQPDPRAPVVRAPQRRLARAPAASRLRGPDRRDA